MNHNNANKMHAV